mmetsp:Transcript_14020/g.28753  ORF Transcript_14020/g.28753 Transcript_14020/m.28753 type:complete len:207 (-) Transcript_14020:4302-4922(-)
MRSEVQEAERSRRHPPHSTMWLGSSTRRTTFCRRSPVETLGPTRTLSKSTSLTRRSPRLPSPRMLPPLCLWTSSITSPRQPLSSPACTRGTTLRPPTRSRSTTSSFASLPRTAYPSSSTRPTTPIICSLQRPPSPFRPFWSLPLESSSLASPSSPPRTAPLLATCTSRFAWHCPSRNCTDSSLIATLRSAAGSRALLGRTSRARLS